MTDTETYTALIDAFAAYAVAHGIAGFVPQAMLCDMDGTLYDSMPLHSRAWKQMADENGLPCEEDEFFAYEGRTGASTLDILFMRDLGRHVTDDEVKRLYHRKTELFVALNSITAVPPMPGAQRLVASALAAGQRTILVTGSGQATLLDRLDTDYPGAFPADRRITAHNVTHGKPHPEPFLRAAALAKAEPTACIALENAPLGVESAHRSGAFTVAVCTGPIPQRLMADAGADIIFDSMHGCADAFARYFGAMKPGAV